MMECRSIDCGGLPAAAHASLFRGESGVDELQLSVRPTMPGDIGDHLEVLSRAYHKVLDELDLQTSTAVLRRFFCSDLPNQVEALRSHPLSTRHGSDGLVAVSWVGQPPLPDAKVALSAYHVRDPEGLRMGGDDRSHSLARGELTHLWTTGITSPNGSAATAQTRGAFERYEAHLRSRGLSLADNVLRTWIFVRDIDADYREMAAARREYFAEHGLTPETHFIASSGIGGQPSKPSTRITMDAYAIAGVRPDQIRHLAALDHLGPTHTYGVTFERATSVAYRDRIHVLLSGTASIDPEGRILHAGDLPRQLERTLENMVALLGQAGATLADMSGFVVYVRDPGDHEITWRRMRERFGNAPIQLVAAPVCRPGWLVEIEGTAIIPASHPGLPPF